MKIESIKFANSIRCNSKEITSAYAKHHEIELFEGIKVRIRDKSSTKAQPTYTTLMNVVYYIPAADDTAPEVTNDAPVPAKRGAKTISRANLA